MCEVCVSVRICPYLLVREHGGGCAKDFPHTLSFSHNVRGNQEKEKQPLPPPRPQRRAPGDLGSSAARWQNSWLLAPPGASRHKLLGRIFYPLRFFDLGLDAPTKSKGDAGTNGETEAKAKADTNASNLSTMLAYPASVLLSQHFAPYVADGGSESGRRLRNVVVMMEWRVSSQTAPSEDDALGRLGLF